MTEALDRVIYNDSSWREATIPVQGSAIADDGAEEQQRADARPASTRTASTAGEVAGAAGY